MDVVWLLVAVLGTALVWWLTNPVLRHLPPPPDEHPDVYRGIATGATARIAALATLAGGVIAGTDTGAAWVWLPLWLVGGALGVVDARTMWLPLRLTQVLAAGVAIVVAVRSWQLGSTRPLVGAAMGAGVYLVILGSAWLARQMGFGDVRLGAAVGALCGLHGVTFTVWALFLGALLGAFWGILHARWHGDRPFAYGPSVLVGPFLALLLRSLTG